MKALTPAQVITTPLLQPFQTYPITVLLVDDQEIIAEKVRSMLASESDIAFHYCSDPTEALEIAENVHPTVILQDLIMPDLDGLDLTRYFRANEKTRDIPLIVLSMKEDPQVKAEAFSIGANDYLVKLPDKVELVARIRYHSNAYIRLLERNEAYVKLLESQRLLHRELVEAAEYVRSSLPPPEQGIVQTAWQFVPSTQLGGDAFGYYWLDDTRFVFYLLDVCGHGVGAALLSISVTNVLRAQTLAKTDFGDPVDVLRALNAAFPMEKHNNMFFTLWYGVYNTASRQLVYASAGHPPALLLTMKPEIGYESMLLKTEGLVIGAASDVQFKSSCQFIPPGSQLFVFSDGTYEVTKVDKSMLHLEDWLCILIDVGSKGPHALEEAYARICSIRGSTAPADDYSLLHLLIQ